MKKLLALSALSVVVATPALADPTANLSKLLANTKSMSANFSQTTKGLSAACPTQSGVMSMQRPNKFYWEITNKPCNQLIVANGNTLWIYNKDLNQAIHQSANSQMGDTPALLLSGNPAQINKSFTVTQPNAPKNYFVLTPKSANGNFKSLSLSFNGGKPVMMVLNDNSGGTTVIRFSNISLNGKVDAGKFNFTPPKGAEVIEQ